MVALAADELPLFLVSDLLALVEEQDSRDRQAAEAGETQPATPRPVAGRLRNSRSAAPGVGPPGRGQAVSPANRAGPTPYAAVGGSPVVTAPSAPAETGGIALRGPA